MSRFITRLMVGFWGMVLGWTSIVLAQRYQPEPNPVFDEHVVRSIRIEIDPADLDRILNDVLSDTEYPARFTYDWGYRKETVENVGFRIRGNTSRVSQKKSFKVSFNTFVERQKFHGLEKLNLNGEHNDPSIIRSKLVWDLFQDLDLPASRASHVRLFINDEDYGLYINVEHVDEQFLQSRFGNDHGNLYKCLYPADLAYKGEDPNAYKPGRDRRPYDLKLKESDDEGYDDLARFITLLNQTPDAAFQEVIEEIFNVDQFLRILAVDVAVGNWDDYWLLKNNFYLYFNPAYDRFEFIPFDYDNTFGIDWFGIDWGRRNVYAWGNLGGEPRPLVDRLLSVPEYRDRYSYYLKQVVEGPYHPDVFFPRIDAIHDEIDGAALHDRYRILDYGFSFSDFNRSYTEGLGRHVPYGIKPFIETRRLAILDQIDEVNIVPIIRDPSHFPTRPRVSLPISFLVEVEDDEASPLVEVIYSVQGNQSVLTLHDEGQHQDREAGDGWYGNSIPVPDTSGVLSYRIQATDASGQTSQTPTIEVDLSQATTDVFINEFMARNDSAWADEFGEYDDWIELYNAGDEAVNLEGYYLTDDLDNPDEWPLPPVEIQPGGFLLIWADNTPDQGDLHASFRLDGDGEQIGLFDSSLLPVDTVSFTAQQTDVSFGRATDGDTVWGPMQQPTPGMSNLGMDVAREPVQRTHGAYLSHVYPNPVYDLARFEVNIDQARSITVILYDLLGRQVRTLYNGFVSGKSPLTLTFSTEGLPGGWYMIRVLGDNLQDSRRVMVVQ